MCKAWYLHRTCELMALLILASYIPMLVEDEMGTTYGLVSFGIADYPVEITLSNGDVTTLMLDINSNIGVHDITTDVVVQGGSICNQKTDITCTDDWIPCFQEEYIFYAGIAAIVFAVFTLLSNCVTCCAKENKFLKYASLSCGFMFCAVVIATVGLLASVFHNVDIENLAAAEQFICEIAGYDFSSNPTGCFETLGQMCYSYPQNDELAELTGYEREIAENVTATIHYTMLAALGASAIVAIMFFVIGLTITFQPCCSRRKEKDSTLKFAV